MLWFLVKFLTLALLQEAWQTKSDGGEDGDGELHEAQVSVSTAEKDWNQQGGLWATLLQVLATHILEDAQPSIFLLKVFIH